MSNRFYYIESLSFSEMRWWNDQGKFPNRTTVKYDRVTQFRRFTISQDFNKTIDELYKVHQMLSEQTIFKFYNSKTKEYYDRDTPTNTFRLRKRKGGYREITVFSEEYKNLHLLLHGIYTALFPVFPDSTGAYIKGKSPLDTINKHKSARVHLSIDLENFYPSVKTDTLSKVLKRMAVVHANLTELSVDRLAEMSTYGGSLAQGSSISPIVANIFSIPLDHLMWEKVKNTNITYTRYADDIGLSSPNIIALPRKHEVNTYVKQLQDEMDRIYDSELKINSSKTKLQYDGQIKVLGINIIRDETGPARLTVGKNRKRDSMRDLFNLLSDIADNNVEDKLIDYQVVRGKIEYLKQFEPTWFKNQTIKLRTTFGFEGDVWNHILRHIQID